MRLENEVVEAKQRLATPGIEAWGLRISDAVVSHLLGGTVIDITPATGCTTEQCAHVSHDPAAPTRRWIPPKDVRLVELGGETLPYGTLTWYVARRATGDIFLQLYAPWHHWAYLQIVSKVPDWVLVRRGE